MPASTRPHNLFDAVLAAMAVDGWTRRAIDRGAKRAGYAPAAVRQAFPDGPASVAAELRRRADASIPAAVRARRNFAVMRVRDKVAFGVRARLEYLEPYRDTLSGLAVWSSLPPQSITAARAVWAAADAVWQAAGDTATDYNRMTKRLLLAGVMQATFAFWLRDTSPGRRDSWAFLDRRIGDVLTLGKGMSLARSLDIKHVLAFVRNRVTA